ncbi:hypothetical protein SAMN05216378_1164 [Paenibacillus catalpae]|uniref:Uncharacterized protein n=1 Tax=Paenibacillus catalpae TaxID=1045775 RepID=A0A1I1USY8_9BACL|nr:hypothetical protein [Paenibacillus catalpae]SFD72788.1 hypothetical protein SAMN05216378_1164 [Paenibacillus catalpae]
MAVKPNYYDMGMSISMGKQLQGFVEEQLINDLMHYHKFTGELRFDWSDSCIEGEDLTYLDGSLDRFSGIMIFNSNNEPVADGWMDFVFLNESNQLIVFWKYLSIFVGDKEIDAINSQELENHVQVLVDRIKDK